MNIVLLYLLIGIVVVGKIYTVWRLELINDRLDKIEEKGQQQDDKLLILAGWAQSAANAGKDAKRVMEKSETNRTSVSDELKQQADEIKQEIETVPERVVEKIRGDSERIPAIRPQPQ